MVRLLLPSLAYPGCSGAKALAFVDIQIAAIAAITGRVVVTANPRDFEVFAGVAIAPWPVTLR